MNRAAFTLAVICCAVAYVTAENVREQQQQIVPEAFPQEDVSHSRSKRTLFLKKKILGAGLLGFGLGAVKGYKFANSGGFSRLGIGGFGGLGGHGGHGGQGGPSSHYGAPPPMRYVEYVENPVYVSRVYDNPSTPSWHQKPPSPVYGSW